MAPTSSCSFAFKHLDSSLAITDAMLGLLWWHLLQLRRLETLPHHARGVALGDSWISPTDFLAAWGQYLNALSLLDGQPLSNTATIASDAQVRTCVA